MKPRSRLALEILESREVFSANSISVENLLPGNPQAEWDVAGAGDSTIQGFPTDISVNHGETISFKVNDSALAPYHIDIYRLGYYGGMGARKVATIPSTSTTKTVQPAPLYSAATKLVDAGNWSVSASWSVPSSAVSGVYIGKLVREDTGGASHMIFVVRDDEGHSDLLFQTSDSTWQAYNNWGGNSLYDPTSTNNMRAYAVSYNRPLTLRGIAGGMGISNSPFWSEVPMIRWIEANGYNVSYTTDVDSDRRGSEILEHRVFMSVGHDEYWSGGQRTNVENALAAGVNLAFFSGNEMYWKTRWESSIDGSGTSYRTLVTYKESTVQPVGTSQASAYVSGVEDPSPIWTGLWRDLRFANDAKVEQLLTGQIFSVNKGAGGMYGTSIQVPAEFSQMRLWRNTSVASLLPGQVATLANGTLGYEWDEAVDSGYQPAGLIMMSSTTENVPEKLVDPISWPGCGGSLMALCSTCRGCSVAPGSATHNLTQYRAPSGALVFGAGTIQWSWGLDGKHDGGVSTPDVRMQQATVNLFADMGVQAGTLQSGLIQTTRSMDIMGPMATVTAPSSSTVAAGSSVTISGTASDSGGGVVAGVQVSVDGGLSWRQATGRTNWSYTWTPAATGVISIMARAMDDSANIGMVTIPVQLTATATPVSSSVLAAAYSFNEGGGATVSDGSSNHNNGTITNATWTTGGMFGSNALLFNGSDSWVTIPDASTLDLTAGMTLEAWVKPTGDGNYGSVLFKERPGGLAYSLYGVNGSATPPGSYIKLDGVNGDKLVQAPSRLTLNAWSHLAVTFDGNTLALYVNGAMVASQLYSGSLVTSDGVLRIGGNSVYGDYFQGLIDEVRIYSRALTPSEILGDMSSTVGGAFDATPPTVQFAPPAVASGVVSLSSVALDNVIVAGVQFLINGQPLGPEITSGATTYSWNTAGFPNGTYTLSVRVRDGAGNLTTLVADPVTVFNADASAPTVAVSGLLPGTTVSSSTVLTAVAADNVGVVGVQFKLNGANLGNELLSPPYSMLLNTTGLSAGSHVLTAVARDAAGNLTTSAPISVIFDPTPPAVTASTPSANSVDVPTNTNPTVTFSEAIQTGTLSFVLKDPGGNPLAGTMIYDLVTRTATLSPNASLTSSTTYTLTVSGAADLVGNVMPEAVSWSFTTASQVSGAMIWGSGVAPLIPSVTDGNAIEVGVKFRSSIAGAITAIEFYKGSTNTGTHIGNLWTSTGTLLSTVTFTNETATGWQIATLPAPVSITENTTYIVSYYAPNGHYAATGGYFASGVNSYPLRALANGEDGANGLYRYGAGGGFPTQSYNSTNYWVDVVFASSAQDTTAPTVVTQTPASGATALPVGSIVTAAFSEPVQANTISFTLRDAANNIVPATVSYNNTTWVATLTPASPLANGAAYTVTLSGFSDAAGNLAAGSWSWPFSTVAALPPPPPASGVSTSLWNGTATPATAAVNDTSATEVGMKFRSTSAGTILGMQFYKGSTNTGTHIGNLWTSSGVLLASATFANETASGWQQVFFSSPVSIAANTTYVVSYFAPVGRYSATGAYFATAGTTSGTLQALATGVEGGNGVYRYGAGGGFPTSTYNSTNYWVDVLFTASSAPADTTAPGVLAQTPAPGSTAIPLDSTVTVTFSEAVDAATVTSGTFALKDSSGATVAASIAYDAATHVATLTPSAPLAVNQTYTASVNGVKDMAGNQMTAVVSWSFATPTPATGISLWANGVPAVPSQNDSNAIEVGVKFRSDVGGTVSGLRFYKGAGNTGTHTGSLWTLDGTLLATGIFSNETATGWQTLLFATPVAISNNVLYIVSYYAPNGHYAATSGYFAGSGVDSGPLHAPADGANGGNGLYRYGAGGGFPGNTYNSANYWVDVIFTQSVGDTTTPIIENATPGTGATGVLPTATLSVEFSEAVQPNTISVTVTDSFGTTIPGNLSYDSTTHIATFIPSQDFLSFVTYTATVTGAKDIIGNTMASPYVWTFRTRGIWTQTSIADFSTGTNNGTTITNTDGGEIRLAALVQDDFNGSTLDSSTWSTASWTSAGGGATTVAASGGAVSVKGAAIYSTKTYTNTGVQGTVSFGGSTSQHFGLATGLDTVAGRYWAIFSTKSTTNTLYARLNSNGTTTDVSLGALPAGYHTYKILPTSSGFEFYVDGVLKTTIAASFQNTVALKASLSNFSAATAMLADSIQFVSTGARTGTFTSMIFDAGSSVTWDKVTFNADVPAGTSLSVSVRVGTKQSNGTIVWTTWAAVVSGGQLLDTNGNPIQGQYLQYSVTMTSNDSNTSPEFDDITFTWK